MDIDPSRAATAVRGRPSGDRGAGTVEYLGGILFVSLLLVSLIMVATPVGGQIAARLCEAVGTSCPAASVAVAGGPKAAPVRPCTSQSDSGSVSFGLDIAFVKLGSGGEMTTERMSDGTYKVTLGGDVGAAAALSAGEVKGSLEIGDYGGSLGAGADVQAGVFAGAGAEYQFDNKEQADEFADYVQRMLVKQGIKGVAGSAPLTGPAVGVGVDVVGWLVDRVTGYSYTPPTPNATYFEGGISGGGSATAGALVGGGNASIEGKNALGFKIDHDTGDRTLYNRVTLDADAAIALGISTSDENWGQGAGGQASMEIVIATTVDKDMQVTGVSFDGVATADGSMALTQLAGFPLQGSDGKGVRVSAQAPVTDANRPQVVAALAGLGVLAVQPGGPAMAQSTAVLGIMGQARSNGDITAEVLDVNSSNLLSFALGLKAPAIGGLGIGMTSDTSSQTTTDAYFLGNNGWEDWTACA